MAATPAHIVPLNVFADVIGIAQGEVSLADRLAAARARVDQFLADFREYETHHPAPRPTAGGLRIQLQRKLKAASTRWMGTEEVKVLREAHARLVSHLSIESKA